MEEEGERDWFVAFSDTQIRVRALCLQPLKHGHPPTHPPTHTHIHARARAYTHAYTHARSRTGKHDDLIAKGGIYKKLVQRQLQSGRGPETLGGLAPGDLLPTQVPSDNNSVVDVGQEREGGGEGEGEEEIDSLAARDPSEVVIMDEEEEEREREEEGRDAKTVDGEELRNREA